MVGGKVAFSALILKRSDTVPTLAIWLGWIAIKSEQCHGLWVSYLFVRFKLLHNNFFEGVGLCTILIARYGKGVS